MTLVPNLTAVVPLAVDPAESHHPDVFASPTIDVNILSWQFVVAVANRRHHADGKQGNKWWTPQRHSSLE